jgi:hypothetical protein
VLARKAMLTPQPIEPPTQPTLQADTFVKITNPPEAPQNKPRVGNAEYEGTFSERLSRFITSGDFIFPTVFFIALFSVLGVLGSIGQREYAKALYEFNKQTYKDALREFDLEQKKDSSSIERSNNVQSVISTKPRKVEQRSGDPVTATAIVAFSKLWWTTVLPPAVVTGVTTGLTTGVLNDVVLKPYVIDKLISKSNPLEPLSKEMLAV